MYFTPTYTGGRALRFAFWTITFPAPSKRKPDSQETGVMINVKEKHRITLQFALGSLLINATRWRRHHLHHGRFPRKAQPRKRKSKPRKISSVFG